MARPKKVQIPIDELAVRGESAVVSAYEKYLQEIVETDFAIFPSHTRFAGWLGDTPYNVSKYMNEHPHVLPKIKPLIADVLIEGMANKKYVASAAKLALKNVCDWEDNPKTESARSAEKAVADEKDAIARLTDYASDPENRAMIFPRKVAGRR